MHEGIRFTFVVNSENDPPCKMGSGGVSHTFEHPPPAALVCYGNNGYIRGYINKNKKNI